MTQGTQRAIFFASRSRPLLYASVVTSTLTPESPYGGGGNFVFLENIVDETNALQFTNKARIALSEAKRIDEVKDIRDKAEAIRLYAKQAGLGIEMQNDAADIKLRAERRAGELLSEMKVNGERQREVRPKAYHDDTLSPPKLEDLGVTALQSSRWQQIAAIPDEVFETHIQEAKEDKRELTTAGIVRAARAIQNENAKKTSPALPTSKYRVIYADPPWKYGNTMPNSFGDQADHYALLSVPEICEIPVVDLAEDNAVLFLWVTSPILEESFEVIHSWGFQYKALFIWDKQNHVMGHYNSVRHEMLLVCTRGSCQPDVHKLFDSVVSEPRTEHSRKPETFRTIIDTLYPHGKRIELFARGEYEGWDVYGNETKSSPIPTK